MDRFRKVYRPLSEDNTDLIQCIKGCAEELETFMGRVSNREMSLAITNLEQAIMWATKAIVLDDERIKQ